MLGEYAGFQRVYLLICGMNSVDNSWYTLNSTEVTCIACCSREGRGVHGKSAVAPGGLAQGYKACQSRQTWR